MKGVDLSARGIGRCALLVHCNVACYMNMVDLIHDCDMSRVHMVGRVASSHVKPSSLFLRLECLATRKKAVNRSISVKGLGSFIESKHPHGTGTKQNLRWQDDANTKGEGMECN